MPAPYANEGLFNNHSKIITALFLLSCGLNITPIAYIMLLAKLITCRVIFSSVARCAKKSRTGAPFGGRARLVFIVRAGAPFGAPFSHLCAGLARLSIFKLFYGRFAKF